MQRLTTLDTLFISLDTPRWPLHGGGLLIFDPDTAPEPLTGDTAREQLRNAVTAMPPLRRRLVRVPFGLAEPVWVEDPDFDFDRHFHHIAIPAPGNTATLRNLVAQLGDRPLDESKPLWEAWFIEGLPDGRVALFLKVHHACIDGMGGLAMLRAMFTDEPDIPHAAPKDDWHPDRMPTAMEMLARAVPSLMTRPGRAARALVSLGRSIGPGPLVGAPTRDQKREDSAASSAMPFKCPEVSFNKSTPGQFRRSMGWVDLPVGSITTVRKAFDVKFNDVALTLVAGSVRKYLLARGELPAEPLTAVNPVNMRSTSQVGVTENRFSLLIPLLRTDLGEPVERLRTTSAGMGRAKSALRKASGNPVEHLFDVVPPGAIGMLTQALTSSIAPDIPAVANMCVTNVSTSEEPLYFCGARLDEMYIMMMQSLGVGPVVALISYAGRVYFTVTANRDLVPDPQVLADGILDELELLLKAAAQKSEDPAP